MRRFSRRQREALERELADVATRLGDDEVEMLLLVARRAAVGETHYGTLDARNDRRDFGREALEEALDLAFYLGAALLRVASAATGRSPQ